MRRADSGADSIASGKGVFDVRGGFVCDIFGTHSPVGDPLAAGVLCEVVTTIQFLGIILGALTNRPRKVSPRLPLALR